MNIEQLRFNHQVRIDNCTNALQLGGPHIMPAVRGTGQVAALQEAVNNLGLELTIVRAEGEVPDLEGKIILLDEFSRGTFNAVAPELDLSRVVILTDEPEGFADLNFKHIA